MGSLSIKYIYREDSRNDDSTRCLVCLPFSHLAQLCTTSNKILHTKRSSFLALFYMLFQMNSQKVVSFLRCAFLSLVTRAFCEMWCPVPISSAHPILVSPTIQVNLLHLSMPSLQAVEVLYSSVLINLTQAKTGFDELWRDWKSHLLLYSGLSLCAQECWKNRHFTQQKEHDLSIVINAI